MVFDTPRSASAETGGPLDRRYTGREDFVWSAGGTLFIIRRMKYFLAVTTALSLCCHLARGDILVHRDGTYSDARVVSQDAKEVVLDPGDGAAQQTEARERFSRILVTDEAGGVISDSAEGEKGATEWCGGVGRGRHRIAVADGRRIRRPAVAV